MLIEEHYPLTGKPYPKRLIFKVVGYSSSTWYENPTPKTGKRAENPGIAMKMFYRRLRKKLRIALSTLKVI